MSLVGELIVGALTLLFGLGGLLFAAATVSEVAEAVRVVTGPEDLPTGGDEHRTYLDVTLADDGDAGTVAMGQVHDTFGYWLLRYWASSSTSNAFGMVGAVLLRLVHGPEDYRREDDRRRGWATVPDTVPVRVDGRRLTLSLGEGAYPLQRLEADGGTTPLLVGVGGVLVGMALLVSPMLSFVVATYPMAGLAVAAIVVGVPAAVVAGKVYHDTGLVGKWSSVAGLGDDSVPAAIAGAGATADPDDTAKVDLATAEPGDPFRVVGTVESTAEGLRVTDGVVSTRGRWFLAVAATLDAVRTAVFAATCLVLAGGGVVLLFPGVLSWLPAA